MEQRKLNDQANTLIDFAKVRHLRLINLQQTKILLIMRMLQLQLRVSDMLTDITAKGDTLEDRVDRIGERLEKLEDQVRKLPDVIAELLRTHMKQSKSTGSLNSVVSGRTIPHCESENRAAPSKEYHQHDCDMHMVPKWKSEHSGSSDGKIRFRNFDNNDVKPEPGHSNCSDSSAPAYCTHQPPHWERTENSHFVQAGGAPHMCDEDIGLETVI